MARELAFRQELASAVALNPHAGRQKINVIQRQLEMMFGNQNMGSVNRFLTEHRRIGENIFTALPLASDDLAVTAGRLDYARNMEGLYRDFRRVVGDRLSKSQSDEAWIGFIEQATQKRMRAIDRAEPNAARVMQLEYSRFVDQMKEMGIDKVTFDQLTAITESATQLNDELLVITRALGLDIGEVGDIGFFPRDMTPDMARRLKERRANELLDLAVDADGIVRHTNTQSSRHTFDWTVSDDYRLAEALGFTTDTGRNVDRWRGVIETSRKRADEAIETLQSFVTKTADEVQSFRRAMNELRQQAQQNIDDFTQRLMHEMADRRLKLDADFKSASNRANLEFEQMHQRTAQIVQEADAAIKRAQERVTAEFAPKRNEAFDVFNQRQRAIHERITQQTTTAQQRFARTQTLWEEKVLRAREKLNNYANALSDGRRGYNPTMVRELRDKSNAIAQQAEEAIQKAREILDTNLANIQRRGEASFQVAEKRRQQTLESLDRRFQTEWQRVEKDIQRVLDEQMKAQTAREQSILKQMEKLSEDFNQQAARLDVEFNERMAKGREEIANRINQQRRDIRRRSNTLLEEQRKLEAKVDEATRNFNTNLDAFLSEMDEPVRKLYDVLDDEKRLLAHLTSLSMDELNRLADEGVLSKIPMTSRRMFEYLTERYELPYKGLREMMVVDPAQAHRQYQRQLQKSLGNTNMARSMLEASTSQGWGVSRTAYLADPTQYRGWVNAYDFLKGQRFDPDVLGFQGIRDLYIPSDVAQHFVALVDVSTSPAKIHWFAQAWQTITRVTKQSELAKTGFMFRNFFGSMLQAFSAGANMFNFIPAVGAYTQFLTRGADALDNTRRVFANGTMTMRDVILSAASQGRISGSNLMGETVDFMRQESVRNRIRWMVENAVGGRPLQAAGDLLKTIDITASRMLSVAIQPTIWMEDLMKITTYLSVLRDGAANQIGTFVSAGRPRHFSNFQDAVKFVDRYFIQYDNISRFDQAMGRNIAPFYTYVTRNIPMQFRNAIQNPGRFAAWLRLYSLMNREAERRGEDLPEGGLMDWTRDGMQIFIPSPDGDPSTWYTLNMEYQDQIAEAYSLFAYRFTDVTARRRIEQQLPSASVEPGWLNYAINSTHGQIRALIATASKRDPTTRRELSGDTSLLGFEVPSIAGLEPRQVRYIIENNVPFVRSINRANPFGVFGQSEIRDANGQVIREARRSLVGNASRDDRDWQITGDDSEFGSVIRWSRILGFNLQEHDLNKNMQSTVVFYENAAREFASEAAKRQTQYTREVDPIKREQLIHEYILFKALHYQTVEALEDGQLWLMERGIPERREAFIEQEIDVGTQLSQPPRESFMNEALDRALEQYSP
jgi:hypothetical protein